MFLLRATNGATQIYDAFFKKLFQIVNTTTQST